MVATQQRLGALLVEMGFIDDAQLASALEEQQRSDKRLGKILVEASILSEDRLVHALSRQLGIEACDPIMTRVHERVLALIPAAVAFKHRVLPVARQREADRRDVVYVATADPLDQEAHHAVAQTLGDQIRVQWMLAGETEMELALARHYGKQSRSLPEGTKVITGVPIAGPPRTPEQDEGSLQMMSSTDDMFVALNDSGSDGATTQPDRPLPSLDLEMGSDALAADSGTNLSVELAAAGAASLDLGLSSARPETEEILLGEEVVGFGEPLSAAPLAPSGPSNGHLGSDESPEADALTGPPLAVRPGFTAPSGDLPAVISALSVDLPSEPQGPSPSEPSPSVAPRALRPESAEPRAPSNPPSPALGSVEEAAYHRGNRSDDLITDELPPPNVPSFIETPEKVQESPPPFGNASWGDLLTGGGSLKARVDDELDFDVTDGPLSERAALSALSEAVELLPIADEGLPQQTLPGQDHPAAPFPPLESEPEIEEPDDPSQVNINDLVARFIGPPSASPEPAAPLPAPTDDARILAQEIAFFASGGALDLSSQQRVLRAIAAVLVHEGRVDPARIQAALDAVQKSND